MKQPVNNTKAVLALILSNQSKMMTLMSVLMPDDRFAKLCEEESNKINQFIDRYDWS